MKIALTGATGFLGHYLARELHKAGHQIRALVRTTSNTSILERDCPGIELFPGDLGNPDENIDFIAGCNAVIHTALYRPSKGFRGAEGRLLPFLQQNFIGSLSLIDTAFNEKLDKFILLSTCAVHEEILPDRPLDELHPTWTTSHYGAHKAAIEQFVYSYGKGMGFDICSLRPTGIYGRHHNLSETRWFDLLRQIKAGSPVKCLSGGKEVHVADVAKSVLLLLNSEGTAGEVYNCYDRYVSMFDVATIAKEISGSESEIIGEQRRPKNQIETEKIRSLGMEFGGDELLRATIEELLAVAG